VGVPDGPLPADDPTVAGLVQVRRWFQAASVVTVVAGLGLSLSAWVWGLGPAVVQAGLLVLVASVLPVSAAALISGWVAGWTAAQIRRRPDGWP